MSDGRPPLSAVPDSADQVVRWEALKATYPQAAYSVHEGWFHGSLRDEDTVLRAVSLERLIGALLEREGDTLGRPSPPLK